MDRLFVTADLHGSLDAWLTVKALLAPGDGLVIAGDLFDTRYGSYSHPDFQPDHIRTDLRQLDHPFYYAYGNCDVEGFFPGHGPCLEFNALGKTIFLHHGHRPLADPCPWDIIIQGHTHLCHLEQAGHQVFMNPGSLARPRNQIPSYGLIDRNSARIVALKTGRPLAELALLPQGI